MDYQKKDLSFGQRVRVIKTNSSLDGIEGVVTGIASINWFDVYIISMDHPLTVATDIMPTFQSFTMPEQHLDKI